MLPQAAGQGQAGGAPARAGPEPERIREVDGRRIVIPPRQRQHIEQPHPIEGTENADWDPAETARKHVWILLSAVPAEMTCTRTGDPPFCGDAAKCLRCAAARASATLQCGHHLDGAACRRQHWGCQHPIVLAGRCPIAHVGPAGHAGWRGGGTLFRPCWAWCPATLPCTDAQH